MGPQLGLRGGFYAQYFAFAAKQFPFHAYGGAITPAGPAFMPSILPFSAKQFPFNAYGGAITPAWAALMPSILLLQPSNSHLRLWERNYACGGGFYAQYFAFSAKQFPFYAYGSAIMPAGAAFKAGILFFF